MTRTAFQQKNLQKSALVSILVMLAYSAVQTVYMYQARSQLSSPLIPVSTIQLITKIFVTRLSITGTGLVFALLFYWLRYFVMGLIVAGITLLASELI